MLYGVDTVFDILIDQSDVYCLINAPAQRPPSKDRGIYSIPEECVEEEVLAKHIMREDKLKSSKVQRFTETIPWDPITQKFENIPCGAIA
jgi:hypothetical protein